MDDRFPFKRKTGAEIKSHLTEIEKRSGEARGGMNGTVALVAGGREDLGEVGPVVENRTPEPCLPWNSLRGLCRLVFAVLAFTLLDMFLEIRNCLIHLYLLFSIVSQVAYGHHLL